MSNDKQNSTCKITDAESSKVSTEANDKGKFIYEIYVYVNLYR